MSAFVAAAAIGGAVRTTDAGVVYSGPVNINIPSTTQGVYLNVVTGVNAITPAGAPGWDVDPWNATGFGLFNPAAPAGGVYVTTASGGTVAVNMAPGAVIDGTSFFGNNTSTNIAQWNLNSSNNLIGFRLQNEANGNAVHYGWMRVSFSAGAATQPRAIVEYAYEDAAGVGIGAGVTTSDPNAGACCKPDGSCTSANPTDCTTLGGSFTSAGTPCASAGCASRCCKPDGTCAVLSSAACTGAGGVFTANTTCAAACPQPGACCTTDGLVCGISQATACAAAGNIFRGEGTVCTTCGAQFAEAEPNETKATSTAINFANSGDFIRGATTGTSTTSGLTSLDQFLVKTPAMASGIWRNRLVITTLGTAGHTGTIRGLNQTAATLGPWPGPVGTAGTTDSAMQTSTATTTPARMNQWYGFGKQEQVYYRVTGGTTTTSDYFCTWSVDPVTPTTIGPFPVGELKFDFNGQGHTTDSEIWIYDSNLNAIDGFGNDDRSTVSSMGAATSSLQSLFKRTFAAGTYYAAVSSHEMANNKGSPCDDNFRTGLMMDFPDSIINGSTTTGVNIGFAVTDSAAATTAVAVTRPGVFDVMWFKFTVGNPGPTCYANCDNSTAVPFLNVQDFSCFLQKYASQDAYANCDGSTTVPTLNVQDFSCFLQKYASNCSAP